MVFVIKTLYSISNSMNPVRTQKANNIDKRLEAGTCVQSLTKARKVSGL